MPKAEKGSLKDLGKRVKAKGLQKLKFFCQMCEKQCRDANGFKCHLTSDSHLRQMKIFSENAGTYMDRYSKEFEKMFLDTLRMRHSTAKTNANNVYQEVIQDKQHIHMNATIWATLSDFCKYLGKTGKCVVEETERGWYVTYIEKDVTKLQREEAQAARQAAEQAAEIVAQERMELRRVEAAMALDRVGGVLHAETTVLERVGTGKTIQLAIHQKEKKKGSVGKSVFGGDSDEDDDNEQHQEIEDEPSALPAKGKRLSPDSKQQQKSNNNVDQRSKRSRKNDEEMDSDEPWLYRDILVRIVNKKLDKYFRCKAAIDKVNGFTAEVIVVDKEAAGDILRLDQDDLETVAPKKVDQKVRILRGQYRGKKAVAVELDKRNCRAILELKDGLRLEKVGYDDFSMLA